MHCYDRLVHMRQLRGDDPILGFSLPARVGAVRCGAARDHRRFRFEIDLNSLQTPAAPAARDTELAQEEAKEEEEEGEEINSTETHARDSLLNLVAFLPAASPSPASHDRLSFSRGLLGTDSPASLTSSGCVTPPAPPVPVASSTKLEPSRGQVSDASSSSSDCSRSSSITLGSAPVEGLDLDLDGTGRCIQQQPLVISKEFSGDSRSESSTSLDSCPLSLPQAALGIEFSGESGSFESSWDSGCSSSTSRSKAPVVETSSGRNNDNDIIATSATGLYPPNLDCTSGDTNRESNSLKSPDTKITYTLPTPPIDTANDSATTSSFDYSNISIANNSGSSSQRDNQASTQQEVPAAASVAPGVGGVSGLGAGYSHPALYARTAVSGRSLRSRALLSRGASYAVRKMSGSGGPGGLHHHGGGDNGGVGGSGGSTDSKDEDVRQEFDMMERWLDEHPEFVHDYFARKAHKSMVDGWLLAHALAGAENLSTSSTSSKASSGANTPVRKISAQDFERGGILNPIVSTVDGLPTFLGPSCSSTPTPTSKCRRRSKSELKALDEKELMYELVIDICNDLDVTSLCYKILQNLCILLNADRCSLFLVKGTSAKYLASKLFDVTSDSEFESVCDREDEIRIPLGTGIAGYVAKTGEVVNIPDAYEDARFNREIDLRMGYKTRSILSMPIKDSEGEVIGVAQAINKNSVQDEPFDEHDEKVFGSYLAFCGIGLKNAQLYERSLLENRRNQVLLDLARVIFEEQVNVDHLIHKIMMHTQSLLQCERCQVMLVDDQKKATFSQVFDLQASDFDNDDSYNRAGPHEPRFPVNMGITGFVAATGETLNIPDAYNDERFDPKVDEGSDFVTRTILCMPIKNVNGKVIGVSQLVNKLDGSAFNKNDENLFEAFAIFCGMGINNTQMYETAVRAVAKQRVALEVMSYHAIAPEEDAVKLKKVKIPSSHHYNLLDYKFCDFHLDDDNTLKATIRMFLDLNLLKSFNIEYEIFCRWMLSVKKNYRNVTYHNWRHAFNVTQTMYCMLKAGQMNNILTDVECLALMVGCLCHDLDHRGTNNQFQQKVMSPLAELYGTSTMEHHHFDQCIMILSTKGSDIFRNMSQQSYDQVLCLLEKAILSTDLALYFRHRGEFFKLVKSGNPSWHCDDDRNLLRSMMMTASDVSAISKPWEIQKKVASLVASEFFEQGDLEKETLHTKPSAMMDREQADKLPDLQVGFIDDICMPVYEAISLVSTRLSPLLEGCRQNRENWLMQARAVNKRMEEKRAEIADKDRKEEKHEADKRERDRENKKQLEEEEEEEELEEDEDTVVENVTIRLIPFQGKDGGEEKGTKKEMKSKSWRSASFGGSGKKDKSNEEKIHLVKLGDQSQATGSEGGKHGDAERSKRVEGGGVGEGPCIPSTSSATSSPSVSKYFRIGRGGSERKSHSSKRRGFACQGRSRGTDDEEHSGSGDRSGGQS